MASSGKDTEGSQFFLTHSMQPHLDGGYTAFGWVISGEEALDTLLEGHRILEARVRPAASDSRPDPGAGS
jgi:cyclophilin family peptidyl-prolyl cis-trans isomerase